MVFGKCDYLECSEVRVCATIKTDELASTKYVLQVAFLHVVARVCAVKCGPAAKRKQARAYSSLEGA